MDAPTTPQNTDLVIMPQTPQIITKTIAHQITPIDPRHGLSRNGASGPAIHSFGTQAQRDRFI